MMLKTGLYLLNILTAGVVVHRTEYYYNGDGLLSEIKKYEDSTLVNTVRFIRAGFLTVQERDGSNVVTREYMWGLNKGGGIGGLLNLKQSGQGYNYLYDGKGNVMAVIDSNQQPVAYYRYDVFGVPMKKVGTFNQPFRFSTKQYDEQTGLYAYEYRFYNPTTGTWMTRDPLGEAGGVNLYGFVGNNPVNNIDPYGDIFFTIPVIMKIAAASIGVGVTSYAIWRWYKSPGYQRALKLKERCENPNLSDAEWIKAYEEYKDSLEKPLKQGGKVVEVLEEIKPWEHTMGP